MSESIRFSERSSSPEAGTDTESDIQLDPTPGFVIKTLLVVATNSPKKRLQGTKFFINVCHDSQIPEPEDGYGPEVIANIQNGGDWIIPIVVSEEREDKDKAGKPCYVWDCCTNPKVLKAAFKSIEIRALLIETCIELVEDRGTLQLSREFTLPKLASKGIPYKTLLKASQIKPDSVVKGVEDFARTVLGDSTADALLEHKKDLSSGKHKKIEALGSNETGNINFPKPPSSFSRGNSIIEQPKLIEEITEDDKKKIMEKSAKVMQTKSHPAYSPLTDSMYMKETSTKIIAADFQLSSLNYKIIDFKSNKDSLFCLVIDFPSIKSFEASGLRISQSKNKLFLYKVTPESENLSTSDNLSIVLPVNWSKYKAYFEKDTRALYVFFS
ncbi:hypothetical protein NADFUDRAFT_48702 [Nadsonia fulvescens var. elongata DSM 6958]|uniref:PIH1 N-terminal domain-containing protein n=1 Tax=Nadsonia fulvescens var. elongata DSM 6958 TaxID=857566 RepID=A0A1E3PSY8_9ASCO|nr:hypothetical protein NADFUDRAFT_48702 [Nadsonia fulvescens var. elongata DSM 6958]